MFSEVQNLHEKYNLFTDLVGSLECWQCIGEDCHLHPHEVHTAEKRSCMEGESCLVNL